MAILVLFILGSWSYTNASSSVDKWGKISSRMCDGARQSPIPLQYGEATYAPNLYPVSVYQLGRFNKSEYLSVTNNGHTLMVFFPSCYYFMSLNGLRDGEFCIKQFHFHWGTDSTSGSEHSLNGRFFPLEVRSSCFHLSSFICNYHHVEQRMVNNYRKIQTINPATVLVPRVIFRSWNPASATTTMSAIVCAALFALTTFTISAA
ncbi:unnamed protein product [Mesocestoides corti]|uniref:carbonic anhydrase n=1 Tax=Mesocestoides corti TaxID=53468 RepID=A0A3P6GXZ5_MESCO|nr:unnamed protein product [Mesocestoides corti]